MIWGSTLGILRSPSIQQRDLEGYCLKLLLSFTGFYSCALAFIFTLRPSFTALDLIFGPETISFFEYLLLGREARNEKYFYYRPRKF